MDTLIAIVVSLALSVIGLIMGIIALIITLVLTTNKSKEVDEKMAKWQESITSHLVMTGHISAAASHSLMAPNSQPIPDVRTANFSSIEKPILSRK